MTYVCFFWILVEVLRLGFDLLRLELFSVLILVVSVGKLASCFDLKSTEYSFFLYFLDF